MHKPMNQPMPQSMSQPMFQPTSQPMSQSMLQPMYPPMSLQPSVLPQQSFTSIPLQSVENQQLSAKEKQEMLSRHFGQENLKRDSLSPNEDFLASIMREYPSSKNMLSNLTAETKEFPQSSVPKNEEIKKKTSKYHLNKKEEPKPKPKRKSRVKKPLNEAPNKEDKDIFDDDDDGGGGSNSADASI